MKLSRSVLLMSVMAPTALMASESGSDLEKRIEALESKVGSGVDSGFEFHTYARSGLLINDDLNGAIGTGPYMTAAGAVGAPVGRLGLEDDTYAEAVLDKNKQYDDGSSSKYRIMLASGVENKNTWVSGDADMHVRQAYSELTALSSFSGAFENATIWAGKRFDRNNYDIHFMDIDVIFLGGTGAGIYDMQLGENWKSHLTFYGTDYADMTTMDIENYTLTSNNFFGPWQLMGSVLNAADNDQNGTDYADTGLHGMLAYHAGSFYGAGNGFSKTGAIIGQGLGSELKAIGTNGELLEDSSAVRVFSYGVYEHSQQWQIAPSFMAEHSQDRKYENDEYTWAVFNLRTVNPINQNFQMVYEATYQYMDLDNGTEQADGGFYKLTLAPTFKPNTAEFWGRPEIRTTLSYVDWDSDLDDYSVEVGGTNFMGEGGELLVGLQMEVWF